jgi:hypothetical protein
MVMAATTAMAAAAPSTLSAPAVAGSPQAVVMEIPDDDVLPPGWDQWVSLPASAPEPPTGALVVRGDVGAALGSRLMVSGPHRRTLDPRRVRSRSESMPARRRPTSSRPRRSKGLWRELRDHGASLNRALNEALRIHSGPAWRVFQVSWISSDLAFLPPSPFRVRVFPDSFSSRLACWRQDLEHRAQERYDALDRLDVDLL